MKKDLAAGAKAAEQIATEAGNAGLQLKQAMLLITAC
jgi:hypothetical protein